jgi:hypothetical protein
MRLFHQPSAQNLAEWHDVATRDLVPSAQARIRTEIEAHYAEAVQSRMPAWATETEAQTSALADLGDVNSAARRFRREYLTMQDIQRIVTRFKNDARDTSVVAYLLLAWLFHPTSTVELAPSRNSALFLHFILSMTSLLLLIGGLTCLFTHKKHATAVNMRWNLWVHFISLLSVGVLTLVIGLTAFRSEIGCVMALLVLVSIYAYGCHGYFRLGKKMLSANQDDFPPPDSNLA